MQKEALETFPEPPHDLLQLIAAFHLAMTQPDEQRDEYCATLPAEDLRPWPAH